jgi:hypothetical protein
VGDFVMKQIVRLALIVAMLAMPSAAAFAQEPDMGDSLGCDPSLFITHVFYILDSITSLEDAFLYGAILFGTVAECWDDWLMMLLMPPTDPATEDIFPQF